MDFDDGVMLVVKLVGFLVCAAATLSVCWQAIYWLWSGTWLSLDVGSVISMAYEYAGESQSIEPPTRWIGLHQLLSWTPAPLIAFLGGAYLLRME